MAISYLTEELYKAQDRKEYSAVIFLNLSKAFDTIYNYILLLKLKPVSFSNISLPWFASYSKETKFSLRDLTPQLDVQCGVSPRVHPWFLFIPVLC